ncbi:MAG: serine/threonine protein kinase [Labilithrix sp.]|nr:serine/threonine protein kinase [Labilithrix sp.]
MPSPTAPTAASAALGALGPGSVIGELTIVAPLGEGGMGAVYVAEQASTGKRRALKLMHREIVADAAFKRRFEQEAKVGARIRSEHVVEVLAAGVDEPTGLPYLVMELLDGQDLRYHLRERGRLEFAEVRTIFEQLCHAMSAAHEAGVVHRDLKPENVFLARSLRAGAAPFVVKVLDFGIAKIQAEASTRATRGAVGSPLWMAPEQTAPGPVTPAADVWALGLIAFELLTGHSFWRAATEEGGTTAQLLREIVLDPIPPASLRAAERGSGHLLPARFDTWFARAVAREPAHRFGDAGALWRAMEDLFAPAAGGPARDAFAETAAASDFAAPPARDASETLPPRPVVVAPASAPRLAGETPLESAREVTRPGPAAAPSRASMVVLALAAVVAAGGVGLGVHLARAPRETPAIALPVPAPSALPPVVAPSASAVVPVIAAPPPAPVAPTAPASVARAAPAIAASTASSPPPPAPSKRPGTNPGGFVDPSDRNGPVLWKVQDRQVRLFTRLVKNDSNVNDATVRKAVEWSSWEYLRCYERVFGSAKDLPEGVVTVGFDILDQLPRHAALVSSTVESPAFNTCVVQTLIGQTINAAGPDGKGHVVHAFRFVPN